MPEVREAIFSMYQVVKALYYDLFNDRLGWIQAQKEHWAMGLMVGFSAATTVSSLDKEMPRALTYLTAMCFLAAVVKYTEQNWEHVSKFAAITTLSLLIIIWVLIHGTVTPVDILIWTPPFLTLTLMTSVNMAPGLFQKLDALREVLSITIHVREPSPQARDLHQGDLEQGLSVLPGMTQVESASSEDFPEHENDDFAESSIELDAMSVRTSANIRALVTIVEGPNPHIQERAIQFATQIETEDSLGHVIIFPSTPEDEIPLHLLQENEPEDLDEDLLAVCG